MDEVGPWVNGYTENLSRSTSEGCVSNVAPILKNLGVKGFVLYVYPVRKSSGLLKSFIGLLKRSLLNRTESTKKINVVDVGSFLSTLAS